MTDNAKKLIKVLIWCVTVPPLIFIIAVLATPFHALCIWACGRERFELIVDEVGEKLRQGLIDFAGLNDDT